MSTTRKDLPNSSKEWHAVAEERKLQSESIYGEQAYNSAFKSASVMHFDQFLLLRVIYRPTLRPNLVYQPPNRNTWLRPGAFDAAVASLKAQQGWRLYLNSILPAPRQQQQQQNQASFSPLGLFSLVRYYQLEVQKEQEQSDLSRLKIDFSPVARRTRQRQAAQAQSSEPPKTPTRPPRSGQEKIGDMFKDLMLDSPSESSPDPSIPEIPGTLSPASPLDGVGAANFKAVNDEQIVNTALLLYLNALTISCSEVQGDWTLHRRRFVLESRGKKVYEARVDGYLRSRDNNVKAIVEVKPYTRSNKNWNIRMQEAGQMAAWIGSDPPDVQAMREQKKTCRRLLVSQDRHEIYVTIAKFDADYVDYICGHYSTKHSLLEMQEYGPFETDNSGHMSAFGHMMLAFTIDESITGS
ncbi:hypothetical protein F5Y19DRAFT_481649 [Xylariaceae sp. FL1651]|nr:hypothetical protein F5Y19DRAFT_481649 [Xylariaceae sp. FL1651]